MCIYSLEKKATKFCEKYIPSCPWLYERIAWPQHIELIYAQNLGEYYLLNDVIKSPYSILVLCFNFSKSAIPNWPGKWYIATGKIFNFRIFVHLFAQNKHSSYLKDQLHNMWHLITHQKHTMTDCGQTRATTIICKKWLNESP